MRRVFSLLSFFALLSLFGSFFYYVSVVTTGTMAIATIFAILGAIAFTRRFSITSHESKLPSVTPWKTLPLFFGGISSLFALLFSIYTHPITSATRSLWLLFSPSHILLLGIAFLCVLLLSRSSLHLASLLGAATVLCAATLAAILFPLGFGFDPFLHRATLAHIIEFGTITPKPFYYIGAYSIELFGALMLQLPLFFVDVFLAPLGLAVLAWIALRSRAMHPATLAILPLAAFVSTTPQAIGFLWVLATTLALKLETPRVYALLFAIAACVAHPIAGVPALVLVLLSFASATKRSAIFLSLLTILGTLGLPLLFFAQQIFTGINVGFDRAALTDLSRVPPLGFFGLHGHALLDSIMLTGGNLFLFTVLLALVGFFCQKTKKNIVFLLAGIVAFGNFFVLSLGFDFPFLISYERTDFALRMITIAWLFLLPFASDGIAYLCERMFTTKSARIYGVFFATLFFCANVYVAYPRHDGYSRSAAFNVTPADIEIVHRIADDAGDAPYVVLSNQTLASAAIQELGFFQYYHGDIFAYPVPTSGPLYKIFLSMIEEGPTIEKIQDARDLTGASTVYFVVHDYWWEADERIAGAKKITDDGFTSDDGTVTVFTFSEKSP